MKEIKTNSIGNCELNSMSSGNLKKNLGHFIFSLQEGTDKPIIDFKENPLALLE